MGKIWPEEFPCISMYFHAFSMQALSIIRKRLETSIDLTIYFTIDFCVTTNGHGYLTSLALLIIPFILIGGYGCMQHA